MADEYIQKDYAGGAEATSLASSFSIGGATLSVADGSSYPNGTSGPFVVVVDRGLATEEKFLIDTTTGANGVTFNIQQAGYDGTTATNHSAGATVEHCIDAYSIEQANRYVNLQTSKGDLVAHTGSTTARQAVGSNNAVLVADSTQSNGIKWSTLGASSLASDSVTTAKILDSNVTLAKLASAVQNLLVPAGTIAATVRTTADTGWLLLDGSLITSADSSYPALWAIAPSSWKTGTSLQLPNLANKMLEGAGTTTLGASGGSNTVTLLEANLPPHAHTVDPPSTSVTSGTEVETPGTSEVVYNANNYGAAGTDYRAVDQGSNPVTNGMSLRDTSDGHTHTHSVTVDIAQFNSGNGAGSSTAVTVTNAHVAVNFQIKAH